MTQEPQKDVSHPSIGYLYFYCPDCEWDTVHKETEPDDPTHLHKFRYTCPLCAEDNGRDVFLRWRQALESDKPEAYDARKDTRKKHVGQVEPGSKPFIDDFKE
jgi:hypothetical protein